MAWRAVKPPATVTIFNATMGHIEPNTLAKTRKWQDVVGLIEKRADNAVIAERTLHAAQVAYAKVADDAGFREAAHLMVQLAVAGTKKDPVAHLAAVGIQLGESGSLAELSAALSQAISRRMSGKNQRTDWGEMARGALVTAVTHYMAAEGGASLFSKTHDDLAATLRKLKKPSEFAVVGQKFIGTLTNKFLNYFLTKKIGGQVGLGKPFASLNNLGQFKAGMNLHCQEASAITESYFSGWLKKQFRDHGTDITRESAEKFMWWGVEKMRKELAARAI